MSTNFWDDADIISSYSRAQAIEDGVLVEAQALVPDEPEFVQQAGWKVHVALTSSVAAMMQPNEKEREQGQDLKGRLWDLLWMSYLAAKRAPRGEDTIHFQMYLTLYRTEDEGWRTDQLTEFKAVCGPGDDAEPVVTFMLPEED